MFNLISAFFDSIRSRLSSYGRDDRGIGVVEVILILVGICIAKKRRILCGNFRCI